MVAPFSPDTSHHFIEVDSTRIAVSDPVAFAKLRDVLADLYFDVPSAQRVIDDAGVDRAQISFSSRAKDNWHAILREAAHKDQIDNLITVVTRDYGSNDELKRAIESFRASVASELQTVNPEASTTIELGLAKAERTLSSEAAKLEHPALDATSGQTIITPVDGRNSRGASSDRRDNGSRTSSALMTVWFPILGAVTLVITIAFFMWLVQAGRDLSETQAFLTILIVSLAAAATTFFVGSWAKAQGAIAIPWLSDDPVKFATTGGIAAFIIVLVVAIAAYKVLVAPHEVACNIIEIEKFWVTDITSVPVTPGNTHVYLIDSATDALVIRPHVVFEPNGCNSTEIRYEWVARNAVNEIVLEATGPSINYPVPLAGQDQIVELTAILPNTDSAKDGKTSASFTVRFVR
jgi:hypothetical protein